MSLLDTYLPELHRVRVRRRGEGFVFDQRTYDAEQARRWFDRYAEDIRAGRLRGHVSHSRNGVIDRWTQTQEGE